MRVWHVAKTWEGFRGILKTGRILANGRNVAVRTAERFAHVSTEPFPRCGYTFDMFNAHEFWEFEVEIAYDTRLIPDPSGDHPDWMVSRKDLVITRIERVLYIEDVFAWAAGYCEAERLPLKRFGDSVGKVLV